MLPPLQRNPERERERVRVCVFVLFLFGRVWMTRLVWSLLSVDFLRAGGRRFY